MDSFYLCNHVCLANFTSRACVQLEALALIARFHKFGIPYQAINLLIISWNITILVNTWVRQRLSVGMANSRIRTQLQPSYLLLTLSKSLEMTGQKMLTMRMAHNHLWSRAFSLKQHNEPVKPLDASLSDFLKNQGTHLSRFNSLYLHGFGQPAEYGAY